MTERWVLEAQDITRDRGGRTILDRVSLALREGEAVALMGPSGCGKTTLLHVLGLLDRPSSGRLSIVGVDPWRLGAHERAGLRLHHIGFVFQQSNLLPFLSAEDNVSLPAWRAGRDRRAARKESLALLERFGLGARAGSLGGVLSLGEAQRVATARALVNRPALVLADEPTGSLDTASTAAVLDALDEVVRAGSALLVATHDPRVAARMERIIHIRDGGLHANAAPSAPTPRAPSGTSSAGL